MLYLINIHARRSTSIFLSLGIAGIMLASCGTEKTEYQFENAQEGINYYQEFVEELKSSRSNDMASIAKDIAKWQEMEDSVVSVIRRDTAATNAPHFFPYDIVAALHTIAREEFLNRAIAKPRTMQDLLSLHLGANPLAGEKKTDEALAAATPFFLSLDGVSIYNMDCDRLINRYETYLLRVERSGIHNKEQLLTFMREEDRFFRSFVTHLWEMDGKSATNITKTTERIYAQLSKREADFGISDDDLYVLLTMRTNRRLLVNAQACLLDIKSNRVKTDDQRRAYQWMILQPFTTINNKGLALLTDAQKATFQEIAKEASSALARLAKSKEERERMSHTPRLMIEMYISSL